MTAPGKNAHAKARAGSPARRIAQGALLGAGLVIPLFLVGRFAFDSSYYTQWLIASGGFFCILVAWLLRIRAGGFFGAAKPSDAAKSPEAAKPSDAVKPSDAAQSAKAAQYVLLAAGLFLLLAATILNAFFGIGAGI